MSAEYNYATMVKASYFPDVELVDSLNTEKKYMKLRRMVIMKKAVQSQKLNELSKAKILLSESQKIVDENFRLHRRHDIVR